MAAQITTWEQSAVYDPTNPNQIARIRYAGIPGRYASFYYNKVPGGSKLQGVFDSMPSWLSAGIVGALGLGVGYFGMKRFGGPLKKKLGLSGARRRRRR